MYLLVFTSRVIIDVLDLYCICKQDGKKDTQYLVIPHAWEVVSLTVWVAL